MIGIALAAILLLAACQLAQPQATTPPPILIPSPVATGVAQGLPTSTSTVEPTGGATFLPTPPPTNTPVPATPAAAAADLQRLHLGWIWPQDETEMRAEFAVGADGVIYINDLEGRLHAVRLPGQLLWTFDEPQEGIAPPMLGDDGETLTFVTVGPDKLYLLGTDGKVRRTVDVPEEPYSYPIVAPDGTVYLGTSGGVYRFPSDGGEQPSSSGPASRVRNRPPSTLRGGYTRPIPSKSGFIPRRARGSRPAR